MMLDLWRSNRAAPKSLLEEVWGALDEFDRNNHVDGFKRFQNQMIAPPCDISETPDHFLLTFDAPGLKKEDIHIELTGRQLTISGERKREEESQKGNTHRLERSFGSFSRSFDLPEGSNTDTVEATYDQGVVKVSIAKAEVGKTKKIQKILSSFVLHFKKIYQFLLLLK